MTNRSGSGVRGIRYAIAIGLTLALLFFLGEYVSDWKRPGYYRAARTTTLSVRTQPGKAVKITAEPLPIQSEVSADLIDRSVWLSYKSEAPTQLEMIEPPAGTRLLAPVSLEFSDPFLDPAPSIAVVAEETEISESIEASTVSSTNPVVVRISGDRKAPDLWGRNWPRPLALETAIDAAQSSPVGTTDNDVREWLAETDKILTELQSLALGSLSGDGLLESLGKLASRGHELARIHGKDGETARSLARISYAMERRHAVWSSIQRCILKSKEYVAPRKYTIDSALMASRLQEAKRVLVSTEDSAGWNAYLMLDRIEDLAKGRISSKDEQIAIARNFLHRVTNTRVTPEQFKLLRSAPIHRLADQVHPMTVKPVDYRKLVLDIETIESYPVHRCSADIADAVESLRFSEHPEIGDVAWAINTHYRNANVRMSVSEAFLNRLMPRGQVTTHPVKQRILGADTHGASRAQTDLALDLVPDPQAWRLRIKLDGQIESSTQSSRNGATFFNSSSATVQTHRELRVDGQSLSINGTPARVESSDSLRRFSTDWDSLPIVGDMIRYVAHREFVQSRPIAKRITQRLIAEQTDEEFDKQLNTQISTARQSLESRFLGPLQSLQLSPLVMDMQSTDNRLIARYRLADECHLSAHTPRPLAPSDSQLSVQIHQSIFNNLAGRAIDTSRDWSIQQLSDSLADLLQQPRPSLGEDVPQDVTIRFAASNPISIEFEDGKMSLTLRIASLEQPGRIHIKNFMIRSSYAPSVQGLQAELLRDGGVSVDGHRMGARDRLPLRAIFTKVFSARANIPMVAQSLLEDPRSRGLVVSQFEMCDGWLAIAVSEGKEVETTPAQSMAHSSR
ncbi:MAG: hypothetical protein ACK5AC_12160 [Planctomycetota bacterium]